MKSGFKTIGVLLIIFGVILASLLLVLPQKSPLLSSVFYFLGYQAKCETPISYRLGTVDPRFNLSREAFLEDITEAESLWEEAFGKPLFSYSARGDVEINLIYDIRQEATQKLQSLGMTIEENRASYDALKLSYDSLRAIYNSEKASLDLLTSAYDKERSAYESEVASWNRQGGAPVDVSRRLNRQKTELILKEREIGVLQEKINALVDEINSSAVVLNHLAGVLKINVSLYNTVGFSQGAEFEQGEYKSSPSGKQINVYQFSSREKLIRVLAHELGHALGIDHLPNPSSIMYELNQSSESVITDADLAALTRACGVK